MALSDQLTALQTSVTAQTDLISQLAAKVTENAQAVQQLADASTAVTSIQSTVDSNTSALNSALGK